MPARTDNFQSFVKQKKGSAIKEEIKQQKKKEKKERAAAIDAFYDKKRAERQAQNQQSTPGIKPDSRPEKVKKTSGKPPRVNKYPPKSTNAAAPAKPIAAHKANKKTSSRTGAANDKKDTNSKPSLPKETSNPASYKGPAEGRKSVSKTSASHNNKTDNHRQPHEAGAEQMPLNKYIAHGGLCSRRDAAVWVKDGKVTVNDVAATDPGMKITSSDVVKVGNKRVIPSRNFVYILLNKPKDYITTSEDPQGRKTVLDLVRSATSERIYPVGRLDRNTSGVLLLTNDGELAQKLSHPKHEIKKVYEVRLDRALTKGDMDKIATGIVLEDGFVAPDVIAYADFKDKSVIGIEIHSGRNRIVRRIFEHLKYDVKGLDRVMFAGLTKKDVQRGKWRFLKDREIRILKFMNQSFVKVHD